MAGNIVQNNFTIGTSSVQVQGPSDRRFACAWSGVSTGRITLSPTNPAVDGNGIVIQQGDPPLMLSRVLHS